MPKQATSLKISLRKSIISPLMIPLTMLMIFDRVFCLTLKFLHLKSFLVYITI